jgi:hypothetical protein
MNRKKHHSELDSESNSLFIPISFLTIFAMNVYVRE